MSTVIQRSFAAGEISPGLYARADQAKYAVGLRTCKNFQIMRNGGATNRAGFEYINEVKESARFTRLIPFIYNDDQTYVLEFGNAYMRVYRNGGAVANNTELVNNGTFNSNITGWTTAGTVTWDSGTQSMRLANSASTAEQLLTGLSVGAEYTLSLRVVASDEPFFFGQLRVRVSTSPGGSDVLSNTVGLGAYSTTFVATATSHYLTVLPASSWAVMVDDVSVVGPGGVVEISTPYAEIHLRELLFAQSGDVVTITHASYAPRELKRTSHTSWTLTAITFAASIAAPASPALSGVTAGSNSYYYVVTAVKDGTYEESVASAVASTTAAATPTEAAPIAFSWSAVSGAAAYNVYRGSTSGVLGYLGQATGTSFRDTGRFTEDYAKVPPTARNPFNAANLYPAAVAYYQQRRLFGYSNTYPETIWGSKIGAHSNFDLSYPLQEDDALTYALVGNRVNHVRHLLEVDSRFIVLTSGSEKEMQGDTDGTLTPTSPNVREIGRNGASTVAPVIVDATAVYVQARGNKIRDLRYEVAANDQKTVSYRGRDLSVYADHLFTGYTVVDMAYQQIPYSTVWCVRDDGVLLGLTYVREHDIWAWHRHTTDGTFESICVVPEGDEDVLYAIVKRTINGASKRYIERMHTRRVTDISIDAFFVDSGLTYDGRNLNPAHAMTVSGGTNWTVDETLTLTSSTAYFVAGDVGNEIVLRSGTDTVRFRIAGYTSSTVVTGNGHKTIPSAMRATALGDWGEAVDELSGLGHLEGKAVSILADGSSLTGTVTGGALTLARPYEVIHVGLAYESDLEPLDLESLKSTLADKTKRINRLTVYTQESRGFKVGIDAQHLKRTPVPVAQYDDPDAVNADKTEVTLDTTYTNHGRVLIRQDEPLPLTVLALAPAGFVGG